MTQWNDKTGWTMTFNIKPDKSMEDFMMRMQSGLKDREDAIRERIKELFDEYIKYDGQVPEDVRNQVLQIFAIGYQLGWNDNYSISQV